MVIRKPTNWLFYFIFQRFSSFQPFIISYDKHMETCQNGEIYGIIHLSIWSVMITYHSRLS